MKGSGHNPPPTLHGRLLLSIRCTCGSLSQSAHGMPLPDRPHCRLTPQASGPGRTHAVLDEQAGAKALQERLQQREPRAKPGERRRQQRVPGAQDLAAAPGVLQQQPRLSRRHMRSQKRAAPRRPRSLLRAALLRDTNRRACASAPPPTPRLEASAHHDHGLGAAHEDRARARHVRQHAQARLRAHAAEGARPIPRRGLEARLADLRAQPPQLGAPGCSTCPAPAAPPPEKWQAG